MNERAKEIAQKIIADVWPDFVCDGTRRALEAAVEKHMMTPHRVKDRNGTIWEQLSGGRYASGGINLSILDKPATIQGEPLPDPSELAAARERIAELEKQLSEADARIAMTTGIGATIGKTKPEAIWQLISEDSWVFGVKVRGAVRAGKANVYFNGRDWVWYLTGGSVRGEADYFSKAIDAAEKAMRIT